MMTTMSTGAAMPPLDVSAALQAAVAAAAEIARVGMTDMSFAGAATRHLQAMTAGAPSAQENEMSSTTSQHQPVLLASSPLLQHAYQLQQLSRPLESSSSSSTQPTGQTAAGDQENRQHHEVGSAMVSVSSANDANDAAGEKTFEESEEDAAKRLARSRERNREHARRTRLRKKAQLEALQSKVCDLEAEKKALKQKIEECSIASILINLAEPSPEDLDEKTSLLDATMQRKENQQLRDAKISLLTAGKRKRFASVDTSEENKIPQTLKLQIDGETTLIGPKSHINWKSGLYSDESGAQRQLTSQQLEGLRRERNRMHAKMTRDRKKNFISTIEKTIEELERDCQKMRDVLEKVGAHRQMLTAPVTPLMTPRQASSPNKKDEMERAPPKTSYGDVVPVTAPSVPVPVPSPLVLPSTAPDVTEPVTTPAPTPSLLLPSLAAAIVSARNPITMTSPENHRKRVKASHGFSWNG